VKPIDALHHAVEIGDLSRVQALATTASIDDVDAAGLTALMLAARCVHATPAILRVLIDAGANLHATSTSQVGRGRTPLSFALSACDIHKTSLLLDAGADLHYSRDGYTALIDAALGGFGSPDDALLPMLRLLVSRGASLDDVTRYGESALSVLSLLGRFAAVRCLLDAGADPAPLKWTALHSAIALGSLSQVNAALDAGADVEVRDAWGRTPLLLAIHAGDQHKAELLMLHGADRNARGRCGKPALFYPIERRDMAMLTWLLAQGYSLLETDDFGMSALAHACEYGDVDAVRQLLDAGQDPDAADDHRNALYNCEDPTAARLLLDAGADPQHLQFEVRRALVGLPAVPSLRLCTATRDEAQRGAVRRFGSRNPERMDDPFWLAMLRSGVDAWSARQHFSDARWTLPEPGWCAGRFGQSITFLPDGRVIQIAGEHEDGYDPDFCIYNDVFVHEPDGRFAIYGYPENLFPPTDFHSATLVGGAIVIIGNLGYSHHRTPGVTPVFTLDTSTLKISRLHTKGEQPGWLYRHRAVLTPSRRIRVFGGRIESANAEQIDNSAMFELDLTSMTWMRIATDAKHVDAPHSLHATSRS
jgi:ankyrin repeat protein